MNPQDFEYLKEFLKTRSGIVLSADKLYLVESRLTPVARDLGLPGIDELIASRFSFGIRRRSTICGIMSCHR